MATSGTVCLVQRQQSDLPTYSGIEGSDYLKWVSKFVRDFKNETYNLKKPVGATLKIRGLNDTIYRDEDDEVNGWGKFYLPNIKQRKMQVIGVVDGTSCPCEQLVLMTCEDRKVYAYDGEYLHLVASSLKALNQEGIEYPASTSYYDGQAFEKMTEEDWAEVKRGSVWKCLKKEHNKLVTANKTRFLDKLK